EPDRRIDQEIQVGRAAFGNASPADRRANDRPAEREPEPLMGRYWRIVGWIRTHRILLRNSTLAVAVFLAAFFFTQWWDFTIPSLGRAQYQAIFLANGQTYFGRYYDRIGAYAK